MANKQVTARLNADRDWMMKTGGALDDRLGGYADEFRNRANWFNDRVGDIAGQMGGPDGMGYGLTPEERAGIEQRGLADTLRYTPDDYNESFLTGDEERDIVGDPSKFMRDFDPGRQNRMATQFGTATRGALDRWGSGTQGALDRWRGTMDSVPEETEGAFERVAGKLRGGLGGAAMGERGGQTDILGPADTNIMGTLRGARADALDGQGLSDRYKDRFDFTDGDRAQLESATAGAANAPFMRAMAATRDAAVRGGNVNALALGARLADTATSAAPSVAQAVREAKAQGRQMQLNTEQQREGTRLGAEAQRAGLVGDFARMDVGAQQDMLGRRQGAESRFWDRTAQGELGGAELEGQGAGMAAGQRFNAGMGIGQAGFGDAADRGRAGIGVEGEAAAREQDTDWRNQTQGAEWGRQAEMEGNRRQTLVAGNRQETRQQGAANRYNRNLGAASFGREGAQFGAGARRQDQQGAAGLWQGLGNQQTQGQLNTTGQMGDNFGRQISGVNNNSETFRQNQNQPGFWDKAIGAAVGLAGAGAQAYAGRKR
jgi:hypothetical protein